MSRFEELNISNSYDSSDSIEGNPIDFYKLVIPNSKDVYIRLGYFTSYAISILSIPLTEFLLTEGKINIITNHFLTEEDANNIIDYDISPQKIDELDSIYKKDPRDFEAFLKKGSVQFYNCINYLQEKNRLCIQPVFFTKEELNSHHKQVIATDGEHYLFTSGSSNLTAGGLVINGENISVHRSWKDDSIIEQAKRKIELFKSVLNGNDPKYPHASKQRLLEFSSSRRDEIEIDKILEKGKSLKETFIKQMDLIDQSIRRDLYDSFEDKVEQFIQAPRRPDWFNPREYQVEAYHNWLENNSKGLFAMATGTGKTLTAINILEREYNSKDLVQAIILVPTKTLAYQWLEDLEKFNFTKILFTVDNSKWYSEYSRLLRRIDNYKHFIILTTYATFNSERFQTGLKELGDTNNLILVGDEVHNIGSPISLQNLPHNISNRIGLSATPERVYDETGSKEIEEYFQSFSPEYTYRYSMKKAIEDEKLCPYDYFPRLVMLDEDELNDYKEISRKLMNYFDSKTGQFSAEANNLLMLRKRIIHKARRKRALLSKIISELEQSKGEKINYAFVYVPEGKDERYINQDSYTSSSEDEKVINQYADLLIEKGYSLYKFIGGLKNRKVVLDNFKRKKLQILLAMKCLDEGVNVPRTEIGIFCSSTGNPRQFIQRRGRLLRTHAPEKKKAIIYDMIVAPPITDLDKVDAESLSNMEINLFKSEVKRVANFAYMADNKELIHNSDVFQLANQMGVGIYEMMNENLQNDE